MRPFLPLIAFLLLPLWAWAAPHIVSISPHVASRGSHASIIMVVSGADSMATVTTSCPGDITITSVTRPVGTLLVIQIEVDSSAHTGCCDVYLTNLDGTADTAAGVNGICIRNSDISPPTAYLEFPLCNAIISCADSALQIRAFDQNGIDTLSPACTLFVDDDTLIWGDPRLHYFLRDSTIVYRPVMPWREGIHYIRMLNICDTLANCSSLPDCAFSVDLTPPQVVSTDPAEGSVLTIPAVDIIAEMYDALSEIDSTTLNMVIWTQRTGSWPGDTIHVGMGAPGVRWTRSNRHFSVSTSRAGITFEDNDTVYVCLRGIADRVDNCAPNVMPDYCWSFRMFTAPVTEMVMEVRSIGSKTFPAIRAGVQVFDQLDRPVTTLREANFEVYEEGRNQYPLAVWNMGGGGKVDIVFVVDETGDMSGSQAANIARMQCFADSLSTSGIDWNLGLISFKDLDVPRTPTTTEGYHLFTFGGIGATLTNDPPQFIDSVAHIEAMGGGDGQENQLDAIMRAVNDVEWRSGSRRVIIVITGNTFCERGDCSSTCMAHYTYSEVLNALLDGGVTLFEVCDTMYDQNPCTGDAWHHYHGPGSMTDETGGECYQEGSSLDSILYNMNGIVRGGYVLTYTTDRPFADCSLRDPVTIWAKLYTPWLDTLGVDTIRCSGDTNYWAPCSPSARILLPQPNTITSDPRQQIKMSLRPHTGPWDTTPFDPASILLNVAGQTYRIGTNLVLSDTMLTFSPPTDFANNQVVPVNLMQANTFAGRPALNGPLYWKFSVDREGPIASDLQPPDGSAVSEASPIISAHFTDNLAGIKPSSMNFALEGPTDTVTFANTSPGIAWNADSSTFTCNPAAAGIAYSPGDTVCVTLLRMDDQPDYGSPNRLTDRPVQWCFTITGGKRAARELAEIKSAERVYDILGREVSGGMRLSPGIYYVNGRRTIIK